MKSIINPIQSIFILLSPLLLFLKPQNYVEILNLELLYLLVLFLILYVIFYIFSLSIKKIFHSKFKEFNNQDLIFIFSVLFFQLFYHEGLRDIINTHLFSGRINSFYVSFILIVVINIFSFLILYKFYKKIKLFIVIFMMLLISSTYLNEVYNLNYSKNLSDKQKFTFNKSELPRGKLNENIYLIILDEMSDIEYFLKQFPSEYKNLENFQNKLISNNFSIIRNSFSAYNITYLNITALMNLNYFVDEKSPRYFSRNAFFPNSIFYRTKNSLQLLDYLNKNNHFMKVIGNSEMDFNFNFSNKDIELENKKTIILPNIFYKFIEPTYIDEILRKFTENYLGKKHLSVFYKNNGMEVLKKHISNLNEKNKKGLYFVHHFAPHAPYLYDENCKKRLDYNKVSNPKKFDPENYKNAYVCVTKQVIDLVNQINKFDKNAIIIFQGDHSNKQIHSDVDRFKIFNAVKLPNRCKKHIKNRMNNINTTRVALYCSAMEDPVLYKNKSFIGYHGSEKEYGYIKKLNY